MGVTVGQGIFLTDLFWGISHSIPSWIAFFWLSQNHGSFLIK